MDGRSIAFGLVFGWLFSGGFAFFEDFYGWRAGHDCSKCRAWSCKAKHCEYKRLKKKKNEPRGSSSLSE